MTNTTQSQTKKAKAKGPIRWEAVVPFTIIMALMVAYFHFFFDSHLRKAMELGGYFVIGSEVNVANVDTSFFKGSLRIQGIQITDAAKPTHNLVEIGDVRFGVLWDGLLRARVVVEEMAVEQIKIGTLRKSPGKVKPPEEKKSEDGPSAVDQLKDKALNKVEEKYDGNVLGDLATLLSGGSAQGIQGEIEGNIQAKKMVADLQSSLKEKQKAWDERLKALPKPKEIEDLGKRLSQVKTKDFKTPQELEQSLRQIDAIVKDADAKYKSVDQTGKDLRAEFKALDAEIKKIDEQIKADIKELEARFKIPSLDANSLSKALFASYLDPYLAKLNFYKSAFEKYAPPNVVAKVKGQPTGDPDLQIQPRPRSQGTSYEFGRPGSYPIFWIKKISVSSQAGASPDAGNVAGQILDITSNQLLTNKPTVAKLNGDFPSLGVGGFKTELTFDNRKAESLIQFFLNVSDLQIQKKQLLSSSDVGIELAKSSGQMNTELRLLDYKQLDLTVNNRFNQNEFAITSKEKVAQEILTGAFAALPTLTLDVKGSGNLPTPRLSVDSNAGREIARALETQIKGKIAEAKAKIEKYVQDQIGAEKAKLEAEVNKIKSQFEGEVSKVQAQIDNEKNKANAQVNAAKKDSENQLKKKANEKLKDLKKKFGL
ncbi:MAG: TIGR03545 family protein [Pseudobdellovibrionaceae bacterium]